MIEPRLIRLRPEPITAAAFAPFGELIAPSGYGTPFGPEDARLEFGGTPRLYIMRVPDHGLAFEALARHRKVTQCLGSALGLEWFLAVAPPAAFDDPQALPEPGTLRAFTIVGPAIVKLHCGTWHAGPYFRAPCMDFLNLELADTNRTDHQSAALKGRLGLRVEIAA